MFRMPVRSILRVGMLLVLVSAGTAAVHGDRNQGQAGPDLVAERALAALASEEDMVQVVRQLVDFGTRMYGTPSNHAAAAWLADAFRESGLEVTLHRDEPRSWYQPDGFEVRVAGAEVLEKVWPHTGSPAVQGEGPLALEPGRGVVWLTDQNPTAESSSGCLAVLYYGRPASSGWPVVGRVRGQGGAPVFGISPEHARVLRARLEQGSEVRIQVELEARSGEAEGHTVVASLPGRDRSRYILFCAHGDSDSGGPGANDNGSGVAIVLGIARTAAAAQRRGDLPVLPWDLRFAVWAGEITSTRQYLAAMPREEAELQAVFNFDQSGYGTWMEALYVEPDDVPINHELITLIRQVMADHLGTRGFPERAASTRSQGGTDSYVFQPRDSEATRYPSVTIYTSAWDRQRTLPVTTGFPPLNWYSEQEPGTVTVDGDAFYHSAGDTPANTTDTEPWNMGWCARVGLLSAIRLMTRQ